jgi:hypothetical protein
MIPSASHPVWAGLITGEIDHKFGPASAGMLFFNLRRRHKSDPSSIKACVAEARAFFQKYERIMDNDIKQLFK